MQFEIKPHEGVNDIKFGMIQSEIERLLPGGSFGAVRNTSPDFLTYIHENEDTSSFYYFSDQGVLNGIEFSREADLLLSGIQLVTDSGYKLKECLQKQAGDVLDDKDGFGSETLGVAVWIQDLEDDLVGSIYVNP
jgi:hypothetical protein